MPKFDLEKLTLGEVSVIEDLSGQSIGAIGNEDSPKGKAMAAIAMVIKRRSGEPTFTFNAALALSMDEVTAMLGDDEDEDEVLPVADPKENSAKPVKRSKPSSSSTSA